MWSLHVQWTGKNLEIESIKEKSILILFNFILTGRSSKVHGGFGSFVCPSPSFGKANYVEDPNE